MRLAPHHGLGSGGAGGRLHPPSPSPARSCGGMRAPGPRGPDPPTCRCLALAPPWRFMEEGAGAPRGHVVSAVPGRLEPRPDFSRAGVLS